MKRRNRRALAGILLGFLLAGCTNNPPVVRDIWWMPVTVKDSGGEGFYRELMLYVQVDDEEGDGDLAELRLTRADRELTWKVDSSAWSKYEKDGVTWLGSSRFRSTRSEPFEEGAYELILEDKGGREDRSRLDLEGWLYEDEAESFQTYIDTDKKTVLITEPKGAWYLLAGEEEAPIPVPVGETFSPADYLDGTGASFYLMMFDRSRMTCYREGPYFSSSVE